MDDCIIEVIKKVDIIVDVNYYVDKKHLESSWLDVSFDDLDLEVLNYEESVKVIIHEYEGHYACEVWHYTHNEFLEKYPKNKNNIDFFEKFLDPNLLYQE